MAYDRPALRDPNRKIIVADSPGHMQYTRNMVTSPPPPTSGLVLVDAPRG